MISLPDALAEYAAQKRWVVWRYVRTAPDKKPTKVPYQPEHPRRKAKNNDPSTWSDFACASSACDAGGFDGVGVCIRGSDIAAFDVDDCRNAGNGLLHPWAERLVERANTYAEITPSKTGIRIIGRGNGVKIHRQQKVIDDIKCESYCVAERYITVTGDAMPGTPTVLADISELMAEVVAELDATTTADVDTDAPREQHSEAVANLEPSDPRLANLGADWMALGLEGKGIAEKYGGDRSNAVFAFVCECLRTGIAEDAIASCLMHWKIGEHVRDQANVRRALNRVPWRARQAVEDSKLFEMNERYCVLPIGGKTRVATWGDDPDFPGHQNIVMVASLADFKALHDKYRHSYQKEDGTTAEVRLGAWWVGHRNRRQYDGGMRFMPSRDEEIVNGNTLNLWLGFSVAARKPEGKSGKAGCQLLLDHGLKIICSGDEQHFDYLMKREALIAQRRLRSEIALGLRTEEEGTGKGFWCRAMNYLYGVHAMQVQNPEHVVGKHNPHLEKLLRLTADEALFAQSPIHRNALYNLITEPRLTIEPKFVNVYTADNHLNVDVISNAEHFLPVSGFARRFFVPTVSSDRANDHEYFRKIMHQLHEGGYEALLYHLLNEIDVRDFNVRDVPKTAALVEQIAYSRKGVDLLVEIACNEGRVPCVHNQYAHVSVITGRDPRYPGFDHFIEHHRDRELARMGSLMVKRRLAKDWGCITGRTARVREGGERVSGLIWPDLADLRAKFVVKYGPQQWQHPEEVVWGKDQF